MTNGMDSLSTDKKRRKQGRKEGNVFMKGTKAH
jgi:hypothetical protein